MRVETIGLATLYLWDCLEVLPGLTQVDACVTDPPYNVGKDYGEHDDSMESHAYIEWLTQRWSLLKADTLLYTPGRRHLWDSREICQAAGYTLARPLAWHKKEYAGDKFSDGPAMCWEPIIWAYRGKKRFEKRFGAMGRDHLTVNSVKLNPYAKVHPCPKPIEVPLWLVQLFAPASVIDPFMGTGTTGEAAIRLGRSFVGIELNPEFFDVACKRIERAQVQQRLFA